MFRHSIQKLECQKLNIEGYILIIECFDPDDFSHINKYCKFPVELISK